MLAKKELAILNDRAPLTGRKKLVRSIESRKRTAQAAMLRHLENVERAVTE